MSGALGRGLAAGAVGTTVLNAVSYLDMAFRGRPASSAPGRTVEALAGELGWSIPGRGDTKDNRRTALGELSGLTTGLTVGVAASLTRALGVRLPAPIAALVTGVAAMAATDAPMATLGVSDPCRWSTESWVSDAVPHLAYGIATQAVLRRAAPSRGSARLAGRPSRASAGLVMRSLLLGAASGSRSTLGLAGPVLTTPRTPGRLDNPAIGPGGTAAGALMLGGELVADKLPATPSRLEVPGLPLRFVSGATGAAMLARRENASALLPAVAGVAGAAAGTWGGAAWRAWAADRIPDWQAALVEDGAALVLAATACLPRRHAAEPGARSHRS